MTIAKILRVSKLGVFLYLSVQLFKKSVCQPLYQFISLQMIATSR